MANVVTPQRWLRIEDPNTPLRFIQVYSPFHWRVLGNSMKFLGCDKSHVFLIPFEMMKFTPPKLKTYDSHISHIWKEIPCKQPHFAAMSSVRSMNSRVLFLLASFLHQISWIRMKICLHKNGGLFWVAGENHPQTSRFTLRKCKCASFPLKSDRNSIGKYIVFLPFPPFFRG